ncbi:MAG: stage III sporulation protein AF [Lachnospiraceae bacterium]|nr:stage III sporulation protein AF [Lachnospiraceae bacterium]
MADFIKSVLIFTLVVTVMKGLINSDSFRMYFKFFSGIVLIMLMITPLINFLSGGNGWYSLLEQEIFNFSLEVMNDELEVAGGKFEEIIREECKKDIKEQIIKLADNREIGIKDIDIVLGEHEGAIQVNSVDINISKEYKDSSINNPGMDAAVKDGTEDIQSIEDIKDIEIADSSGSMEAVDAMSDEGNRRKASGKNVRKLREDISTYFVIKEASVNIWE